MDNNKRRNEEERSLNATISTMRDRPSGVHRCGACGRRGGRNHEGHGCLACAGKLPIEKEIARTLNSKARVKIVVDTAFANGVGLDLRDLVSGTVADEIYARVVSPVENWRTVKFAKRLGASIFDADEISLSELSNCVHANADVKDLVIVIGGIPTSHIFGLGRMGVKLKIVIDPERWTVDGTDEYFCDVSEFKKRKRAKFQARRPRSNGEILAKQRRSA
jgi:hypothetical protein